MLAIPLVALGCGGETGNNASTTPTAIPQKASGAPSPQAGEDSNLSIDQQKERLIAITKELFAGETDEGLPRLAIEPDARNTGRVGSSS